MPVTQICYEVGYNNTANFNRQFFRRLSADSLGLSRRGASHPHEQAGETRAA